jgi:hypothetical protein
MNRKLLVGVSIVAIVAAAAVAFSASKRGAAKAGPTSSRSEHGNGIDNAMGAINALYHAPVGATPCESAYNAFKASLDFSTQQGTTPVVLRLAPHDDFIARCTALPEQTQKCVWPAYMAEHRDECKPLKPPDATLNAMVELKRNAEPSPQEPSDPH